MPRVLEASPIPRSDFRGDLSLLGKRAANSAFPKHLPLKEEEHRLSLATGLVFACLGLFVAHLYVQNSFPSYQQRLAHALLRQKMRPSNGKIYPVIIEQRAKSPKRSDQYRALAEFDAEGRGGITTEYGFHTLSNTDIFQPGNNRAGGKEENPSQAGNASASQSNTANGAVKREGEKRPGDLKKNETDFLPDSSSDRSQRKASNGRHGAAQGAGKGMYFKVPANYRFKQHMALRYDGRSLTAIATESMPGASYFRSMIRQIRETFAPPGQNYIYRDRFGYMINQTIQPQIVSVQFVINRNGLVTDVKVVSSIGQRKVDAACVEVLRNKNFGKPPPEIFRHGNVFGINFVFPDLRRFR